MKCSVLFCSLAVLDPRVGHIMDVLSPFIPVLCHSANVLMCNYTTDWTWMTPNSHRRLNETRQFRRTELSLWIGLSKCGTFSTLSVMFCSLAILDPRVGHTMDVLSPFISVLCHSDWLSHGQSCPRLDVVHPGRAWSSSPACTWHCSLHYLFLQATSVFPHGVTVVCSWNEAKRCVWILCVNESDQIYKLFSV